MHALETSSDSEPRERGGMPFAGWVLVFLVLLYPLSVAPMVKLLGGRLPRALKVVYSPLEALYDRVPVVHDFYDWYFRLWGLK